MSNGIFSKGSNSKSIDSFTSADRKNLLLQRLKGNDLCDSNSISNVTRDPSSSIGLSENPDIVTSSIHKYTNPPEETSRRFTDELKLREEIEKEIKKEYEDKFDKMRQFALECFREYAFARQECQLIEISRKQERLGTITTYISGNAKWCGGIEVNRLEREIETLTKKLEVLKKSDHQRSEAVGQKKSTIQASLKEKKNQLKQLEEERKEFAIELRLNTDRFNSDFKVDQLLNDGKYALIELIGRGGFSEVWRAFDIEKVRVVAIKIQHMNPQWSKQTKENFVRHSGREIQILSSTQHRNVVGFYEYFYIGDNTLALVMEFCNGGDLAITLRKRGKIPEKEAKYILAQVIGGLLALRSMENYVIHYDLKPANILFTDDGTVKITDFGLSKIVEGDTSAIELTSQGTGTYFYAAPETFQRGRSVFITKSVDTWSLGIIFYEMLYGVRPFGDEINSQQTFASQVENMIGQVHFPQNVKVSDQGKKFIMKCLEKDPNIRPELSMLATDDEYIHPILAELNL
ncbi:serine/threonine-protein kinase TOUSLED-like protein [Tritrichomonas foetus]|uniref:Serine/threonine-protein kinase TOUSLED-like protein n=1 Tax=Tritrichomonas foetus TaxID=1144522 RepID=A0A1J4KIF6_9EUKA|nr:serine/threonine-protein kinase TOUSLED-like protein [Tritrichomonas foetus]|eukprot:OHT09085.1 serine/threonine-protein kinase TOUSLED-like protein [Tritrichomonas foetus]